MPFVSIEEPSKSIIILIFVSVVRIFQRIQFITLHNFKKNVNNCIVAEQLLSFYLMGAMKNVPEQDLLACIILFSFVFKMPARKLQILWPDLRKCLVRNYEIQFQQYFHVFTYVLLCSRISKLNLKPHISIYLLVSHLNPGQNEVEYKKRANI